MKETNGTAPVVDAPTNGVRVTPETKGITIAGRRWSWQQVGAAVSVALGGLMLAVGYVGVSGETEVWRQLPYFLSGAVGGLALVLVGLGLYNAHQHAHKSTDLERRLHALELGLGGEFDELLRRLDELAGKSLADQARR